MKKSNQLPRPITVTDLYRMKMNVLQFDGTFRASFGQPEIRGSWLIYGRSAHGKTRFALQLAKYLTIFGKVLFNSLEEGVSASIRKGFKDLKIETVKSRIHLLNQEPVPQLTQRLKLRNSAQFIFIDSIQYTFMTTPVYKELLQMFPDKLFIFTSHAEGKEPKGALAKNVWFDANVKVWIEGYRAFPVSRYGGGEPFDVWPERAAVYWAENTNEHEHICFKREKKTDTKLSCKPVINRHDEAEACNS